MAPGQVDWDYVFGKVGARWFHTGGIFAALSSTTAELAKEAMVAAKEHGTVVSYDLNYRPSLWVGSGGRERAQEVNRALVGYADVLLGNEEDFSACLGFTTPNTDEWYSELNVDDFEVMMSMVASAFPNLAAVTMTLRAVRSATINDWSALAWSPSSGLVVSSQWKNLEILDRIGGGDAFASGLVYGLLTSGDLRRAIEYGAAHGALAMTTPGDMSMASVDEVEALMAGGTARVRR
jgi:2-dehydro-3-deoxygluconokinase